MDRREENNFLSVHLTLLHPGQPYTKIPCGYLGHLILFLNEFAVQSCSAGYPGKVLLFLAIQPSRSQIFIFSFP